MITKIRSYFNPVRIIIKDTDIFKLPKKLDSALFEYSFSSRNENTVVYDGTKIIDPLVNYVTSVPYERYIKSTKSGIIVTKKNDSVIMESFGLVPAHHLLRVHDILMKNYNVELTNNYDEYKYVSPFGFNFGKTELDFDSYKTEIFEKLDKFLIENFKRELLLPLFFDYALINKLGIMIYDPNWSSPNGNHMYEPRFFKNHEKTINFVETSNKFRTLLGGVRAQFLAQGGLCLPPTYCPIKSILEQHNLYDDPHSHYGDLEGEKILIRGGFVPFWQMVYLKESLNCSGFKAKLVFHEDLRSIKIKNFKTQTRTITEHFTEEDKKILGLSC